MIVKVGKQYIDLDSKQDLKEGNMEVWLAFGVGLFLGVVFGVLVMGLMFMAKGD